MHQSDGTLQVAEVGSCRPAGSGHGRGYGTGVMPVEWTIAHLRS
jgi:hypothetical protein